MVLFSKRPRAQAGDESPEYTPLASASDRPTSPAYSEPEYEPAASSVSDPIPRVRVFATALKQPFSNAPRIQMDAMKAAKTPSVASNQPVFCDVEPPPQIIRLASEAARLGAPSDPVDPRRSKAPRIENKVAAAAIASRDASIRIAAAAAPIAAAWVPVSELAGVQPSPFGFGLAAPMLPDGESSGRLDPRYQLVARAFFQGAPQLTFGGFNIVDLSRTCEMRWDTPEFHEALAKSFSGNVNFTCSGDITPYFLVADTAYFVHRASLLRLHWLSQTFDGMRLDGTGTTAIVFKYAYESMLRASPTLALAPSMAACRRYNAEFLQKRLAAGVPRINAWLDDAQAMIELVRSGRNILTGIDASDPDALEAVDDLREQVYDAMNKIHSDILGEAADMINGNISLV